MRGSSRSTKGVGSGVYVKPQEIDTMEEAIAYLLEEMPQSIRYPFTYGDVSIRKLTSVTGILRTVTIKITEAFNNPNTRIAIVDETGFVLLHEVQNSPIQIGIFKTSPFRNYMKATDVNLILKAAGSTKGKGSVILEV